jgi:hypothetical protein
MIHCSYSNITKVKFPELLLSRLALSQSPNKTRKWREREDPYSAGLLG